MSLRTFEDISIYGPPLAPGGLAACISGMWDACLPWAESITLNKDVAGNGPEAFFRALERAAIPTATSIACAFEGQGRECNFSTVTRSVPSLTHDGARAGNVQQTTVFVTHGQSPELGTQLLRRVGTLMRAWFGTYTPEPEGFLLSMKIHGFTADARWAEAGNKYERLRTASGLPVLAGVNFEKWTRAQVPFALGWCNYWSKETCELLQFPNAELDAGLLKHSEQLAGGAWLVKLTNEPLDLTREAHIGALAHMYRRFAMIGAAWRQ